LLVCCKDGVSRSVTYFGRLVRRRATGLRLLVVLIEVILEGTSA